MVPVFSVVNDSTTENTGSTESEVTGFIGYRGHAMLVPISSWNGDRLHGVTAIANKQPAA